MLQLVIFVKKQADVWNSFFRFNISKVSFLCAVVFVSAPESNLNVPLHRSSLQ